MDLEERVARTSEDDFNNYEKLIQKLEAEVRQHIRVIIDSDSVRLNSSNDYILKISNRKLRN